MMSDQPAPVLYSALMAVYSKDDPDWFAYAVDSILNQTIKPAEFIIVADGPLTPELYKIIEVKTAESGNIIKCLFHLLPGFLLYLPTSRWTVSSTCT